MVEGQAHEGAGNSGPPFTTAIVSGANAPAMSFASSSPAARRCFRHLHQRRFRGDRAHQGPEGKINGVVPRDDDARHAERLERDARAVRKEPEVRRASLRLHPAGEVAARVPDRFERGEDLEEPRLLRRTPVEIAVDRVAQRRGVVAQRRFERIEGRQALPATWRGSGVTRAALALEGLREGRGNRIVRGRGILEVQEFQTSV